MNQLMIALIAAAAMFGGGFYVGDEYKQGKWDAEKVKIAEAKDKAIKDRLAENEADRKKLADESTTRSIAREKELAEIRATARRDAGKRVPINPARVCVATGPAAPTVAGSGQQAAAGASELSESLVRDLRQLAADADEVTADARAMREFIRADGVAP